MGQIIQFPTTAKKGRTEMSLEAAIAHLIQARNIAKQNPIAAAEFIYESKILSATERAAGDIAWDGLNALTPQ